MTSLAHLKLLTPCNVHLVSEMLTIDALSFTNFNDNNIWCIEPCQINKQAYITFGCNNPGAWCIILPLKYSISIVYINSYIHYNYM